MTTCAWRGCDGTARCRGMCFAHHYRFTHRKPMDAPIHRKPRSGPGKPGRSLSVRLWEKVDITPTCWLWNGGMSHGCPALTDRGRWLNGRRAAWLLTRGAVGARMNVVPTCRNDRCLNPQHMALVPRGSRLKETACS